MSYSAYDVRDYMLANGVSAADAKRALADPVILDPVQRSADKNFQKALSLSMGDLAPLAYQLYGIGQANSAWSAEQARELRNWQESMFAYQATFNANEAAKNRNWQEFMSNTAHQREIADLKAAGLNPVLSATGGNGAAVTSGATASSALPSGAMGTADTSANSAIVGLLGSMLSAQTQLASTAMSAANNLAITEKNNSTSKDIAVLNNAVSERIAEMYTQAGIFEAQLSKLASMYGSDQSRIASEYAAWLANEAAHYTADTSLTGRKEYPTTWAGLVSSGLDLYNRDGKDTEKSRYMFYSPMLEAGVEALASKLISDSNYHISYAEARAQSKALVDEYLGKGSTVSNTVKRYNYNNSGGRR